MGIHLGQWVKEVILYVVCIFDDTFRLRPRRDRNKIGFKEEPWLVQGLGRKDVASVVIVLGQRGCDV
jgi:hypothetical protein